MLLMVEELYCRLVDFQRKGFEEVDVVGYKIIVVFFIVVAYYLINEVI
jgi:hypothetical protein